MSWLCPPRQFDPAVPEFTDRPDPDPDLLHDELRTLRMLNGQSGSYRQAVRCLKQLASSQTSLSVLDLGTGGADVPRAVVDWARKSKKNIAVTAVDRNPETLRIAQGWSVDYPEIRFERHDLLQLPYPPNSFDVVMCSLVLHHLTEPDAVEALRRMYTFARVGCIVNDLRRNFAAVVLVDAIVARWIHNPTTRHDAKASSRAAFTVSELRDFAQRAGMGNAHIHRHNGVFRMVLTARK